jgi:hypothetical protein
MADYLGAFREGLAAAEEVESARLSIDEVFEQLDAQVRQGSEGRVSVQRKRCDPPEDNWIFGRKIVGRYWAIVGYSTHDPDGTVEPLALWQQDHYGYPCKITRSGKEIVCEDRIALEHALAEMLRDVSVGEVLYDLMRPQPTPTEEGDQEDSDPLSQE